MIARPTEEVYRQAEPTKIVRLRTANVPVRVTCGGREPLYIVFDEGFYNFERDAENRFDDWYVSFSEKALFGSHDTDNFASDDIMALEHPILGSIREVCTDVCLNGLFYNSWAHIGTVKAKKGLLLGPQYEFYLSKDKSKPDLRYSDAAPFTVDPSDRPTPFLIKNIPRVCDIAIALHVDDKDYRIYRNFKYTDYAILQRAVQPLSPPFHNTNIVCMKALDKLENPLRPRSGAYRLHELRQIFQTAYTAFCGVVRSWEDDGSGGKGGAAGGGGGDGGVQLHTGDWGCGEYLNSRVVVAFLQVAAAKAAGVHQLVYHSERGVEDLQEALMLMDEVWPVGTAEVRVDELLLALYRRGYQWAEDVRVEGVRAAAVA
ncbi:hypothetical protein DFJ73DRAFT_129578 [Zopfochytrium polystomum]|nr:hypothetical protein DFJ73DRAFT_129578 [Zopfochytrium polystomum]